MKAKLLLITVLLFTISQISAQTVVTRKTLPVYDGFPYDVDSKLFTEGQIAGQGGWQMFNADAVAQTASNPIIVDSPGWLMGGLPTYTGNALKFWGGSDDPVLNFTDQGTDFVVYSSFVFKIETPTTDLFTTTTGEYFYSFGKTSTTNTVNYASCVYLKKTSAASTSFYIGIAENNNTGIVVWSPTVFNYDQEIVVVIKYQIDASNPTGLSSMWINPVITNVEPVAQFATTTDLSTSARTNIDKIRINKGSNAGTPNIVMDEIRVANTWWEAVGQSNPSLGVSKNEILGLNVYPNPVTNGKVFISSTNSEVKKVAVYNVLGNQLLQKEVTPDGTLDVSTLSKGIYLMKISEGAAISTRKLIIE